MLENKKIQIPLGVKKQKNLLISKIVKIKNYHPSNIQFAILNSFVLMKYAKFKEEVLKCYYEKKKRMKKKEEDKKQKQWMVH